MSHENLALAERQSSIERAWQAVAAPTDAARTTSRYAGPSASGELVHLLDTAETSIFEHVAHSAFRNFVAAEKFPCVGAKSALNRNAYRFGVCEALTDPKTSEGLARDLVAFSNERDALNGDFSTFVSVFRDRDAIASEAGFEAALWGQLQRLHDLDADLHAWDPSVSSDPSDPHFSFSIAGTAFFVVGLHPLASRSSRRFAWPALVFNPHEQFVHLRESGNFERFRDRIRERDIALDGTLNPNVVDFRNVERNAPILGPAGGSGLEMPFSQQALTRIAPQSGAAFYLARGERLRIVDPLGEQVSDFMAFRRDDLSDSLSSGRSLDYASTIYLTTGHTLYSAASVPLATIVHDDVGRHDFLLTPCSSDTFRIIYDHRGPHPSCFSNLANALAPYGIAPSAIPTSFNVFMNVTVAPDGALAVLPPRSRSGDALEIRAETDLLIGLTACSAEMSNNYSFKPIDYEILAGGD